MTEPTKPVETPVTSEPEALAQRLAAEAQLPDRDERAPGRRLAAGLRALIDEFAQAELAADQLEHAVTALAELHRSVAGAPRRPARWQAPPPDGRRGGPSDWLPVGGACNPIAPPVTFTVDGDLVVGEVTYGAAYEGPPGCVHGGMVAAAFDEVLGIAQSLSGRFGMTGTLSVRYRRPTPLHVPLRVVGRFDRSEGRKIFTSGHVEAAGEVTATAEALFIALDEERFAQVAAAAAARSAGGHAAS